MADRRRIVTLDSAGTATTIVDLENSSTVQAIQGTFKVAGPPRRQVIAQRVRRYGGGRVVFETHDNGTISETLLVRGATADICLANASAVYAALESARTDLFYEWRPDGATNSNFYEIRGPAELDADYKWLEFVGARVLQVQVKIPVAPLARLTPQTFAISSGTLPRVLALTGIGGDAPALADVTLRATWPVDIPAFALFGWWKHPTASPLASSVAPLGLIEAETSVSNSGWTVIGTDANYRGSNGLRVTASGAGTSKAAFSIDPSILPADDFADDELDIEVWARVEMASTLVSPRLAVSVLPDAGLSYGAQSYSAEFGSLGRLVTVPQSGTRFRMTRLGVITVPVDPSQPVKWRIQIDGAWDAGSSGSFGLDYLMCVPARARACSKSGVPFDANYTFFIRDALDISKTIRSDLSGLAGAGAGNKGRDAGLGGSLIELPPGDVDMLIKLSSYVPDSPVATTYSETLSYPSVTGSVVVWPRVFLAKGT